MYSEIMKFNHYHLNMKYEQQNNINQQIVNYTVILI